MTPKRIAYMRRRLADNIECNGLYLVHKDKVRAAVLEAVELLELLDAWEVLNAVNQC